MLESFEQYIESPSIMNLAVQSQQGETTTFITPNLLMVAKQVDGVMEQAVGTVVKAEQIEMNHVKVTRGDEMHFFELGEHIKWMEVE